MHPPFRALIEPATGTTPHLCATDEFFKQVSNLGLEATREETDTLFDSLDTNCDGTLDSEEMKEAAGKIAASADEQRTYIRELSQQAIVLAKEAKAVQDRWKKKHAAEEKAAKEAAEREAEKNASKIAAAAEAKAEKLAAAKEKKAAEGEAKKAFEAAVKAKRASGEA